MKYLIPKIGAGTYNDPFRPKYVDEMVKDYFQKGLPFPKNTHPDVPDGFLLTIDLPEDEHLALLSNEDVKLID